MRRHEEIGKYEETHNEDFYTEEKIDLLLEDDEISTAEEGFMRGYMEED